MTNRTLAAVFFAAVLAVAALVAGVLAGEAAAAGAGATAHHHAVQIADNGPGIVGAVVGWVWRIVRIPLLLGIVGIGWLSFARNRAREERRSRACGCCRSAPTTPSRRPSCGCWRPGTSSSRSAGGDG